MSETEQTSTGMAALADRINAEHRACEQAAKSAVGHAMNAGDYLEEAKRQAGHGNWLTWLSENFEGSERVAQTYMRLARNREQLNPQSSTDLSIDGALKALSAPKEEPDPEPSDEEPAEPESCRIPTFEDGVKTTRALAEIRDTGAWRDTGYEGFEEYLKGRWNTTTEALECWITVIDDPPRELRGKPMAMMTKYVHRLNELENAPRKSRDGAYPPVGQVGRSLAEIENDELYKLLGYSTFSQYCSERLGLSRKYREALLLYAELDEVMPFKYTESGLPYLNPDEDGDLSWESYEKGWKILGEIGELLGVGLEDKEGAP